MHDSRSQTRRRHRRWPWILLAAALTTIAVTVMAWVAINYSTSARLRRAVAVADATDPNWRLGDLLAAREPIPDDENSALRLAAAHAKLPAGWMTDGPEGEPEASGDRLYAAYDRLAGDLAPNASFGAAELARLVEDLESLSLALDEARTLADYPLGRWPLPPSPVFSQVGTLVMNRIGHVREVARLLQLDASIRAMNGDVTGALDTARALLNAGRSLGDEPLMISQLVRMAIDSMAVSTIERVLAQGEPDADEPLARLQALLTDEAAAPLQLHAIRGERASMADTFERLATGQMSLSQLGGAPPPGAGGPQFPIDLPAAYYAYNEALVLEFMTDAVAIARGPLPEQQALWDAWEARAEAGQRSGPGRVLGTLTYLALPAMRSVGAVHMRNRAMLEVTRTMVALERFRFANGQWPDSPDQVVPEFLDAVPIDPYTGAPIRIERTPDGLVVYSAGPDGEDDGGTLDPKFRPDSDLDYGLRLWDVEHRGILAIPGLPELPDEVFAP